MSDYTKLYIWNHSRLQQNDKKACIKKENQQWIWGITWQHSYSVFTEPNYEHHDKKLLIGLGYEMGIDLRNNNKSNVYT